MAKRINYGLEKRQKEAKRKKKQEAKLEKKRLNKLANAGDALPADGSAPAATDTPVDQATQTTTEEVSS